MSAASASTRADSMKRHAVTMTLGGIVLFGLVLRLPGMNYCMAFDEVFTIDGYLRRGLSRILLEAYGSGNHPLSSLASWLTFTLLGDEDWVFRLPSLVAGLASIVLMYALGKRIFADTRVALMAAFCLAWSPYHVAYSASFRGYSFVVFFTVVATLFLFECLSKASVWNGMGLMFATFCLGFSHVSALMLLAGWGASIGVYATLVTGVAAWRSWRHAVNWIAASAALAASLVLVDIAYSPTLSLHKAFYMRVVQHTWPPEALSFLAGSEWTIWFPFDRFSETITGFTYTPFGIAVFLALGGLAMALFRRQYGAGILLASLLCPAAALIVLELKLNPRYTLALLPIFSLSLAVGLVYGAGGAGTLVAGLFRSPRTGSFAAVCVGGALLAYFGHAVMPLYAKDFPYGGPWLTSTLNDYKSAIQYAANHIERDDVVVYPQEMSVVQDRYMNAYVLPRQTFSAQPPEHVRLWYLTPIMGTQGLQDVPPGYTPTLAASYTCSFLWVGDLPVPNLHRVALPRFNGDANRSLPERLEPWTLSGTPDEMRLSVTEEPGDSGGQELSIMGNGAISYWRIGSPQVSCEPNRLVMFRVQVRGDVHARNIIPFIQFLDSANRPLVLNSVQVPCKTDAGSLWHPFQVCALVPRNGQSLSVGVQGIHSLGPLSLSNIELWADWAADMDKPASPGSSNGAPQ